MRDGYFCVCACDLIKSFADGPYNGCAHFISASKFSFSFGFLQWKEIEKEEKKEKTNEWTKENDYVKCVSERGTIVK